MSIKRLNYFKGEFLHVDDFKDEQQYHLKAHRLHNKKLHTWGIVSGLDVTFVTGEKKITISQGMAIDGEGRQIIHDTVKEIDFTTDSTLVTVQYVTVSYQETPTDPTEETGIKDYTRITEEPVFKYEKDPPSDQSMALILAKVTLNGDKTVQAVDTDLRKFAGVLAGDLEAISVAFKLPVAAVQWPRVEGTTTDRGLQVTAPWTKLSGNLTMAGNLGIGFSAPAAKLAVNGGLHVGGDSDPGNKNLLVEGTCTVNGNLMVKGTTTTVNTTTVEVADNIITVNKGTTVALTGGLEVYRGGGTVKNAQIIWDENVDLWKIGVEGSLETLATRSSNLFTGNQEISGNLKVTSLTPSAGNAETNGIMFPKDPGQGSGDAAWIRYYPRAGEACTLEIGASNDPDDHIALMPSGNVGVGINNPSDKLEVAGNLRILTGSNPIRFTSGWSGFPDGAGITNQAEISNDVGTYKTLMIIGNKSAGMGRRVSVWDRLEVNGSLLVTGAITPSAGNAETNGIMFPKDPGQGGGDAAWIRYYPRSGEACTLSIGISDNPDDHIALMPSGNVGIKTLNAFQPLTVGDRTTVDGQGVMLRVVGDSPTSWKGGAAFGHNSATVIMGELGGVATIGGHNANLSAWGNLAINPDGGNVGIGTKTPGEKLHVEGGNIRIRQFPANDTTPSLTALQLFNRGKGGTDLYWSLYTAAVGGGWGVNPNAFEIWEYPATLPRLSIRSGGDTILIPGGGRVGVGTAAPTGTLDVNGDIRAGNSDIYFTKTDHKHSGIGNAAGCAAIENTSDYGALMILGRAGTSVGRCVKLWDYLQVNGTLEISGGVIKSGTRGNFNLILQGDRNMVLYDNGVAVWASNTSTSDIRLKKNVTHLTGALSNITQLNGIKFNWIDKEWGEQTEIGVIAQEVEKFFPELVTTDPKSGYKLVHYEKLTPVLLEAIKELKNENDTCKEEISQLKAQVLQIKEKIAGK